MENYMSIWEVTMSWMLWAIRLVLYSGPKLPQSRPGSSGRSSQGVPWMPSQGQKGGKHKHQTAGVQALPPAVQTDPHSARKDWGGV